MTIKFHGFSSRGGWWVIAQFLLFALIVVALTGNRTPGAALRLAGWALIVAAVLLAGTGAWTIRAKITPLPAPVDGAVLMDRGPFALVRHPIYGGVILGFLGLSLRGGNVAAGVLSLLLIPFFYAKTNHEEALLVARFPEYAGYSERVRHRFLPWIL
ncbi:MAG: isoprenylcysteine carboxylmethyltransferase family protein [Acidimicrobiia bacterium]|nr:isoprenylcysteine carboxylmethyltransferase family protein [Acidimicrobiia bacterium]